MGDSNGAESFCYETGEMIGEAGSLRVFYTLSSDEVQLHLHPHNVEAHKNAHGQLSEHQTANIVLGILAFHPS